MVELSGIYNRSSNRGSPGGSGASGGRGGVRATRKPAKKAKPTPDTGSFESKISSGYEPESKSSSTGVKMPSVTKPPVADASIDREQLKKDRQEAFDAMPDAAKVQTSEADTSQGRLNKMLQSDSPLMERARTQGMQAANKRGLINSSMAAGAAQGAMIDRAQPFAMQDSNNLMQNARQDASAENQQNMLQSSTLADSFLQGQQFRQQGALNQQDYGMRSNLQEQQAGLTAQRDAQQFGYEGQLAEQQAGFQAERDRRVADLDKELTNLQAEITESQSQNDFERTKELTDKQANIQEERDEMLFEQGLEETAQEYDFRADELKQEGEQAMQKLYGTSLANAWGVMGNNVTDIVAQAMVDINDIQNNPNIDADEKTGMIEDVKTARDSDVEFQAELYSTLPDTLQNTNVFPDSVG